MKLPARLFLIILSFVVTPKPALTQGVAAAKTNEPQVSETQQQPFTNQLRNTIAFLHVHYDIDGGSKEIDGTAFLISVGDDRLPKEKRYVYLVTNRHMAAPDSNLGITRTVTSYDIFFNTIQHISDKPVIESRMYTVTPKTLGRWYFPEDESVDLAVVPVVLDTKSIYCQQISDSDIVTDVSNKSTQIAPGYQVVFAGFFYQFPGAKKIQPIVRQGVMAMMPDELIPTVIHDKKGSVFLVDAHSYHGNSGSPVFVNTGGIHGGMFAPEAYKLIGVVSGYYPEHEDGSLSDAAVLTGTVHDNSGITIVVPGDQLKTLLYIPALRDMREKDVQKYWAAHKTQ